MTVRTVTGRWLLGDGSPAVGHITISPDRRLLAPDTITPTNPIAVELDHQGRATATLTTTDTPGIQPAGWLWEVVEHLGGEPVRWWFELPDGGAPFDLATVAAAAECPGPVIIRVPGPPGPPGSGGDKHHRHTQAVLSDTWAVRHGLGKHPAVHVEDAGGTQVYGSVLHHDPDTLTIRFNHRITGTAFCN